MPPPSTRIEFEHNMYLIVENVNRKIDSGDENLIQNVALATYPHLKKVRKLPNGRIDLLTINEMIRNQANMMKWMESMPEPTFKGTNSEYNAESNEANTGTTKIIAPEECTKEQLKLFCTIVLKGEQINTSEELLKKNIKNCLLLAFYEIDNKIAGVAAVKIPRATYKKSVFQKAKVFSDEKIFEFEIGYVVTLSEFRGKGISSILIEELIKRNSSSKYFATTKSEFMRKIFKKIDFVKHGESYLNDAKETLDLYIYKNQK